MGKLFTSILNERLNRYSNTLSLINETQAGFRQGYSTLDHIFLLKCVIDLFNWKKRKLFCLFVDYKKAFDLVWRDGLWYKLVKEKVQGKILNVIRNMYDNIRSCVMLNQETSDTFVSNVGVRQGENLSPLLFAFYVNDIESKLIEYNCRYVNFGDDLLNLYLKLLVIMYADDTVILCDSEDEMKQALEALNLYCNEWKLNLNCNKTKVVVFGRGRQNLSQYGFDFDGENIEVVADYKYLGLLFNYNGRFRKGELELKETATRAMYSLISKCRKFDLPVDLQLELFNATVLPILTYACEVWGYHIAKELEYMYMRFLKQVLGVHKNTSNDMVYGELGVFPLDIYIKGRMIGYWSRLITGKNAKLCYVVYQCLLQLDRVGLYTSPWLDCIRKICNDCGMSGLWLLQEIPNTKWVKKAVELKLKDQWLVAWRQNLQTKSLCSNYRMFKIDFGMEKYLSKLTKGDRILVAKFRTCNNRLPVNIGRYQGVSREDRVCNKCDDGVVGDEFHVLLECTDMEIVRIREMYIPNYYTTWPTQYKYVSFMQNTSTSVINKLSLFLRKVLCMFR